MSNLDPLKVVLSVVDPEYPNNIQVEEVVNDANLLKSTVELAKKNGLYYYFIIRLKELNIDSLVLEEMRWNKEKQRLSELKETVKLLNKASNESGVEYILIKACTTVPHIPRDVDIFVRKEEKEKIIEMLGTIGMKCARSDIAQTTLKKENHIETDIYTGISYFAVEFIDKSFLWRSKVESEIFGIEYPGLNAEADLLLTIIHGLFGHRVVTLLDFLHIKSLRDDIHDIEPCRKYAYEKGWGHVFDLVLDELDTIHRRIYEEGEVVHFPHLLGTNFILKCVSMVDGLHISKSNKIFLRISLILDRVIYGLRDSALYSLLKSFEPTRKFFLSIIIWFEQRGKIKTPP